MGRVISRKYEELGQLGQGGQGVVYKVRHIEHKTIMALKALPAFLLEDHDMVSRFEQEAVLMTRLQHRNIARVLGTGRDDALNLSYFVMEYIQGRTLKQYLHEKGSLPLPEVLEIARQVASALDYAHNQTPSIIHRDIKPTNIMIEDHTGRAVVLDFGIAKELNAGEGMRTKTGVMMGTWKYCSPEQLRHEALSGSADVYSLGLVIYEIFTGKQFFAGLDEHAILGKVLYEPQENIPSFNRPVPPAFAALITKAIAKARDKRYRRMADLLNDLEACWWALDETKTMVLSAQEHIPPQREQGQDEIEKIEAQIRQLEEERQRRLLASLQGQVREGRERATKEGARQTAEVLFAQGLTQESAGEEHARNRQYALAQQAYQEALQCFTRAAEEAVSAVLWRQADQSRQEAGKASVDAERYHARDLAPTAYASALATQARAEHAWEQRQYAQARTLYEEARDFFEDARDLAYRYTLKEEAETARTRAQASKEAAIAESVETLARSIFEEARVSEQRGMSALDSEEFTQAREFFLVAQQKYEQAQQQALRLQQRRQEVAALAEGVRVAQQRAQAEGSEVEQQHAYQQAEMFRQQAAALLAANEFTRAQQMFTQAREQYEAATHGVARARLRQQATRIRCEAEAARAGAEAAGAPRWFPTEWTATQQEEKAGQSSETQGELAAAIECYRQATERWEGLRHAALERTAQELTETVRQRTQVARQAARQAAAESSTTARFQQGSTTEQQAEEARARKDFERAQELYEQARRQYEQAAQEAQEEALRQDAVQASQDVRAAQHLLSGVTNSSSAWSAYQHAVAMQKQAETFVAQRQYSQAIQLYTQARTQYEEAAQVAERERQQAALNLVRQHSEAARAAAEQEGAPQRFATAWREAETVLQRARQHEERRVLQAAATVYQEAEQRFTQLQREAQEQAAQAQALAVQQRVRKVKEQAQPFHLQVEAQWNAAQEREARGNAAFQARDYIQAAALYAQAEEDYSRAHAEGAKRQRQEVEEKAAAQLLFQQAQQARSATDQAKVQAEQEEARERAAPLYTQAEALHTQAEELWQRYAYPDAISCYADAQRHYREAQTHAQRERLHEHAHSAKEQMQSAHDGALRAGAQELAREAFHEARTFTQRAERALSAEEFLVATEAYRAASTRYQQSAQQARTETLRREAATSAQLTETVRQRAEAFGKWSETHPSYRQARGHDQHAGQHFQAQEYESAKQEYEEARLLYEGVVRHAEQELQRTLTQAREATEKARREAEQHEAPQRVPDQWAALRQAEQRARTSEARGDVAAAVQAWQELEPQYVQVRATALEHAAHERVTLVQQQVRAAKGDAQEWHPWAEPLWEEAVRQETAAGQALQSRNYEEAEQAYRHAAHVYAQVKKEGQAARLQHEAERAKASEEEQQQQRVHRAQQRATQSQQTAEQVDAQQVAPAQYATALQTYKAGESSLAARQWVDAETAFTHAQEQFLSLAALAQNEQAKRLATTAREEALTAQQDMQRNRTAEFFPQPVAEVNALLRDGEQEFQRSEFTLAHKKFRQGIEQLQQLAHLTARQLQKEHAEQVKAQALALQSQLQTVKGAQHKQAKKAVQRGDQLFAREHYLEAVADYETAVTLWTALQQTAAATATVPEPSIPAPQQSISDLPSPVSRTNVGYTVGGVVLLLLVSLYFVSPFRETVQQPEIPLVTQEAPTKTEEQQPPVQKETPKTETALAPVPEKFPTPTPKPLRIAQATPASADEVAVDEGKKQTFVVVIEQDAPAPLNYVWQINGKEVFSGTGKEASVWAYHPGFDEGGEQPKTVEVVVTDEEQQSVRRNWSVRVRNINRAPRLLTTSPQPGKPLTVRAGEVKEFAVEASDPDTDDRLAYTWLLDGKEVARENRWQFHIPPGGGTHTVSVAVSDQGGAKVQQEWLVSLQSLPPTITKTMPASGQEVGVEEGKPLTFAVVADSAGKGPLRYSWQVDGKVQAATGPQWTYIPGFSDGADQLKQIKVNIIDRDNQTVTETWKVRVHDVNQPPTIVRALPDAGRPVEVTAEGVQDFLVKATDPDRDDRLAYVWSLDGQEVARSERWQFRAPATAGDHQVRVEIQDRNGMKKKQVWQVLVKAVAPPPEPPVWSIVEPRTENLTMQAGEEVTLAATAELPRQDPATKSVMRYVWTLNNEPAQASQPERFRFSETTPDTYQVAVVAIAPTGLKSSPQRWMITVRPRDVVVAPPAVSGKTELREAEVQEWLETYRRSWESKNTDQLVSLGLIPTQGASNLKKVLAEYKEFRVALSDVDIQAQGTQATVSFKRVDTMDGTTVAHPNRTTILLEKRPDGRIVVRR